MKHLLLLVALTLTSIQAVSQTAIGSIEGRVTRPGGEGISDVQVTLFGPGAAYPASAIPAFYTPNPALTPAMRAEIDAYLDYPYLVGSIGDTEPSRTKLYLFSTDPGELPLVYFVKVRRVGPISRQRVQPGSSPGFFIRLR